tara:strand:- start:2022 stop:2918 length:897 start_codon:yes stop_codon:yes gene_type:complete
MNWTEVRVTSPLGWHELVAEALALGPCTSVAVGATRIGGDIPPDGFHHVRTFIPTDTDTPQLREQIRTALDLVGERTGMDELIGMDIRFHALLPEDYATSWRKTWKPFRVGKLVLHPSWDVREVKDDEIRLLLEPGGSFGSGRHATTRTCLKVIQERGVEGSKVLDAGSGSGILSVVAKQFGAADVLAFDIDPVAEVAGAELASDNDVQGIDFRTGGFEVLGADEGPFDVVLANIYSDIIQLHAGDLAAHLAPHGWFAFSGCPIFHYEATRAAIDAAGFDVQEVRQRGRWVTFVGRHA